MQNYSLCWSGSSLSAGWKHDCYCWKCYGLNYDWWIWWAHTTVWTQVICCPYNLKKYFSKQWKLNLIHHERVQLCRCGRCKLQNVKVQNEGINWNSGDNIYWKHDVQRFEALKIILHGNAEFEATNVILQVRLTWELCRYAWNSGVTALMPQFF